MFYVEGEQVGKGFREGSFLCLISLDETLDVCVVAGKPVTEHYLTRSNEFEGEINKMQIDLKPDHHCCL